MTTLEDFTKQQAFLDWLISGSALKEAQKSPEFNYIHDDLLSHACFGITSKKIISAVLQAIEVKRDGWAFDPEAVPNMISQIEKLMTDNEPQTAGVCYTAFLYRYADENKIEIDSEIDEAIKNEVNRYEADYYATCDVDWEAD